MRGDSFTTTNNNNKSQNTKQIRKKYDQENHFLCVHIFAECLPLESSSSDRSHSYTECITLAIVKARRADGTQKPNKRQPENNTEKQKTARMMNSSIIVAHSLRADIYILQISRRNCDRQRVIGGIYIICS